ncbi:MAG: peptidylprolyl isomerase [Alphaproteobacteria bacterium]|nr:peptidylprolyl isomerase [Alphaproteobacteria bacterium]
MRLDLIALATLSLVACASTPPAQPPAGPPKTMADIIAASDAAEWRPLDLPSALVMTLAGGRTVVIELNPTFAPKTTANILTMAREKYFDGLAVLRVQDNFVTQWGDPNGESAQPKSLGTASAKVPAEFSRDRAVAPFVKLPDGDGFAREVGFVDGFPVARNRNAAWLAHCYGMVGAGRNNDPDSGPGSELYVVIGHAPRQLDRNITLVGRVVQGMEHLSALPRGTGPLGFYEQPAQRTAIESVRIAAELPEGGVAGKLEALRTTSASFTAIIEARRNRRDDWYKVPAGHIDLCSVPLPVRAKS